MSDVTHILTAIEQGDANAADKLLPLVYEELRKLAAHKLANDALAQIVSPVNDSDLQNDYRDMVARALQGELQSPTPK